MRSEPSGTVGRLLRAGLWGAFAGAGALALDLGLLRWTLGYLVGIRPGAGMAYLVAGALLALGAQAALELTGGPSSAAATGPTTGAMAAALLYLPALVERVHHVLPTAEVSFRAIVALVVGSAAFFGWLQLLHRLSGSRLWAWALVALSAAFALAANRNLAPGAFSTLALGLDAATAAATLSIAMAARFRRRVRVAVAGIAGASLAGLVALSSPAPPAERPHAAGDNLLLVVIDTLRLDVFDDVVARTPEGARFARALAGATWFDNATAIAPWTAPSMGSILTGLYPAEHGFDSPGGASAAIPPLSPQVDTLAQRLQRRGYHCEGLVTQPYIRPGTGMERGFAHYELLEGAGDRLPLLVALTRLGLLPAEPYQPAARVRQRLGQRLARLEGHRGPYFFFVHLLDPHVPLHAHPELAAEPASADLPADEALYRQEVRYALGQIAEMLELIAAEGRLERWVVAVTADHGELFRSDQRFGRPQGGGAARLLEGHGGALYAELLRVPLVVRAPGGAGTDATRHSDALVSHVDLVPTLLELLGQRLPFEAERWSVAGAMAGGGGSGRGAGGEAPPAANERATAPSGVNVAGRNPALPAQVALRSRDHWLIHYPDGELPDELYDLAADPKARLNFAAEQPDIVATMRAQLEAARSWLTPPPAPPVATSVDEETRRRLKALGYL